MVLVFMEVCFRFKMVVVEEIELFMVIGFWVLFFEEVFSYKIFGVIFGVFMRWFVDW